MPNRKGRFVLHSETSKIATGSALYQHQDEKPRLIAYASNSMSGTKRNQKIVGSAEHILSIYIILKAKTWS